MFGAIFSKHPGRIRWRHLMWGLALQFIFGLIILRWKIGRNVFDCVAKKVIILKYRIFRLLEIFNRVNN